MSAISKQLSACSIDLARPVSSPITLSLSSQHPPVIREPGRPLHEDAPAFIVTRHSLPSCERHRLFPTPARCCSLKPQRPQRDFLDSCLTNHHAFLGVLCVFA